MSSRVLRPRAKGMRKQASFCCGGGGRPQSRPCLGPARVSPGFAPVPGRMRAEIGPNVGRAWAESGPRLGRNRTWAKLDPNWAEARPNTWSKPERAATRPNWGRNNVNTEPKPAGSRPKPIRYRTGAKVSQTAADTRPKQGRNPAELRPKIDRDRVGPTFGVERVAPTDRSRPGRPGSGQVLDLSRRSFGPASAQYRPNLGQVSARRRPGGGPTRRPDPALAGLEPGLSPV